MKEIWFQIPIYSNFEQAMDPVDDLRWLAS